MNSLDSIPSLLGLPLVFQQEQGSRQRLWVIVRLLIATWAIANILFTAFLWLNHINFPFNLDSMEGTILQHVQRAVSGQPIYSAPASDFTPLAYNVGYYLLAVPFTWIFGVQIATLRFVSILAMFGSGVLIFRVVQEKTRTTWWALIAVGLFAAAYDAMHTYLDTAHADGWMLFTALLGTYIIDRKQSPMWNIAAVLILISSFWFKQHGALFLIGGILFLTWREGIKRSLAYWLLAGLFGPLLYLVGGPVLFGLYYHYFTWEVPRHWSTLNLAALGGFFQYITRFYLVLAMASVATTAWRALKKIHNLTIWDIQLAFAILTGLMASLDNGAASNVYIPLGTWFIIMGTIGLYRWSSQRPTQKRLFVHLVAIVVAFGVLLHNPIHVIVSPNAAATYADLVTFLHSLPQDAQVYEPWVGYSPNDDLFHPHVHWVAIEDMIRGPGHDESNHPLTRELLDPLVHPKGPSYILTNLPLEQDVLLDFLTNYYVLDANFGDRFKLLDAIQNGHAWPRYFYRYAPDEIENHDSNQS